MVRSESQLSNPATIDAARNIQPKKLEGASGVYLLMDIRWTPVPNARPRSDLSNGHMTPLLCRFPPELFNTLPPSHLVSITHPFTAIHST